MNSYIVALLIVGVILLIPLTAMQFSTEVNWSVMDFVVAGVLLFGLGVLLIFILSKLKTTRAKVLVVIGLLAVFLLIWAELAVGIFGTPFAGS